MQRGLAIFLTICWIVPGCFAGMLLTARSCNEHWTCRAATAQGVSLSEETNHCQLPFAGTVLQDQGTGWLQKCMKGGYFIRLSELIKRFSSKPVKEKNVNNPERKDSESQGCMWLCNDMSPDQKWTLWKMDTRDKTQNIVWIWSHLSLIGTCGACFFRALVAFMNIIVPIKSACIISKLILWWTLSWSFLPLSKEK